MTFGTIAAAVLASLAIVSAPAAAAYAGQQAVQRAGQQAGQSGVVPAGNDVSFPQCDETLPSGQAFGIVDVNDGLANTTNPCLDAEITWAQASSGATRQPKVSLYVNTANPGNRGIEDWPRNNNDPVTGNHVADPYGACRGGSNRACAWQYGWNMADLDVKARGVTDPGSYRWWLDVETINSWQSSSQDNRADLEGMVTYFRRIGGTAGIYSTVRQWDPLVGKVPSTSPLYRLPDWIPGAKTLSQAKKNCRLAPLTGGGSVTLTQWKTLPVSSDFSCPAVGHG